MRRRFAIAWAVLVAALLLAPGAAVPSVPWWVPATFRGWVDCLVHGVLFLVQMLLAFPTGREEGTREGPGRPALILLAYAVLLELLQIPIPGRSFQLIDILFAGLGIAAALLVRRIRG